MVEGRIQMKGRVGFVLSEDPRHGDVLIEGPSLRLAMADDRVRVRVTSRPDAPRRSGILLEVIERAHQKVVGSYAQVESRPVILVEADSPPIRLGDLRGQSPGDGELIVAEITEWPTAERPAIAALIEILGPRSAPGVELKSLIHKYGLADAFAHDVESAAASFGEDVPEDAWKDRQTLFDRRVFTIDGADAKDFDDAVSLERGPNGLWRLGVHIADVAHYVQEGSAIDHEAYRRGTSVYLSGVVLPMLPFSLSDGLCSLRPDRSRLTMSCEMDINAHGEIVNHRIFPSAIRSARRFTYEQVDTILRGETVPGVSPEIHADVQEMDRLARIVRQRRVSRGSLDFDFPEAEVVLDLEGRPTDIRRRERLESHRLIEDFMLLANETVARHMKSVPFLYRVHETPDPAKLEKLRKSLEVVGLSIPREFDEGQPMALQKTLKQADGKPYQAMVHTMTLRSLRQAVYSAVNAGHFGLASSCYTHFTSPIRRYPDLVVHRLLKEQLSNRLTPDRQAAWKARLPKMAADCSRRERNAVDAEREYMDVQKVRLMEKFLGDPFTGVISGVTKFGIFVQLNEYFVEGLVHVSHLRGDYYEYDEVRMVLRGTRSGRLFQMGQPVEVQLAAANPVKRQLDFELLEARPEKGRRPDGGAPKPAHHAPPENRTKHPARHSTHHARRAHRRRRRH